MSVASHTQHIHVGALYFLSVALIFFQIVDGFAVVALIVGRFAEYAVGFGVVFAVWPTRYECFAILAGFVGVAGAVVYLQRVIGSRFGVWRTERQFQKTVDGAVVVAQTKFGVRVVVECIFFVFCLFAVQCGKQNACRLVLFQLQIRHGFSVQIGHIFVAFQMVVLHLFVPSQGFFVFFCFEAATAYHISHMFAHRSVRIVIQIVFQRNDGVFAF